MTTGLILHISNVRWWRFLGSTVSGSPPFLLEDYYQGGPTGFSFSQ